MYRFTRLCSVVFVLWLCCAASVQADGKGQGGRGGGSKKAENTKSDKVKSRGVHNHPRGRITERSPSPRSPKSRSHDDDRFSRSPRGGQHGNSSPDIERRTEDRKLAHRKSVADHLRQISEKNGNANLQEVAERMEQKSKEHYAKRLEKINRQSEIDELPDDVGDRLDGVGENVEDIGQAINAGEGRIGQISEALEDGSEAVRDLSDAASAIGDALDGRAADRMEEVARQLTGRDNALYHQLRNAEQKLAKRLEAAEHLRRLAEQTGDTQLLVAAENLEERALTDYESRLAKITYFRERFDLPSS